MAHFDGAVRHSVNRFQRRNDFATGKDLNVEVAISCRLDMVGHGLRRTENRVERFGKR